MNTVWLCRRFLRPAFVLTMLSIASAGLGQRSVRVEIRAVPHPQIRPAPGTHPGLIGNVQLISPHGGITLVTKSGLAFDAKASANGKVIGWIEGQIEDYPDQDQPLIPDVGYPKVPTLFTAAVVVRRNGKQHRFVPEKRSVVVWKLLKDGRQIGIGSTGSHGPTSLRLYDTSTGKLLAAHMDYEKHLPAWTQGLFTPF